MINNRVRKLQDLEAQIKELESQAEALRDELKADLTEKGEEEHNTGSFVVRWKMVFSSKLDSKALKASYPDMYASFSKPSNYRRFSVSNAA
jgi:predicted phage-related endonuclease